ncbi:hypothetical protein ACS0TY_023949 [Phlomoides rotata]
MIELLKFTFSLHFVIIWRIAIWSVGLLSLPVHAFSALYRETPYSFLSAARVTPMNVIVS